MSVTPAPAVQERPPSAASSERPVGALASAVRVMSDGSVTSARGFRAGALAAGIKASGKPDLGLLASDAPCVAAATFTQNAFPAAPVLVSKERVRRGRAQAIVFNSGNANACNGDAGLQTAQEMTRLAAAQLRIGQDLVLVASTGVIGHPLPLEKVRDGLPRVDLRVDGGHDAARAIMTTDSRPKEIAVAVGIGGVEVRVGAMAKGVGMIHPNMATMLAFIATDASIAPAYARRALKRVVDRTFNMVTVDGDTSTNDSCFLLANGLAGNPRIAEEGDAADHFEAALERVCTHLARAMAADGEGATTLIEVEVRGARSLTDARRAARAVVNSSLFKAAVHGKDPNWGRILAAVGNSGARVQPHLAHLWIGDLQVAAHGVGTGAAKADAAARMQGDEVHITVDLGLGDGRAVAWGCDLTERYVVENSAYTT